MTLTAFPTFPPIGSATFNADAYAWALFMAGTHATELDALNASLTALAAAMSSMASGAATAIPYMFSTTTTDADPTPGYMRLDQAVQNTAGTIRTDLVGSDGSTWTSLIDTFDDSTSTIKGFIMLQKVSDATKWLLFSVSALASPSGYKNITVTNVTGSAASPFSNGDALLLKFQRNGDKGDTGAAGADGWPICAAGGTVDAITANYTPDITLTDMTKVCFVSAGANATATPTFTPDGLTTHTITARGGAALVAGDIGPAGAVMMIEYNLANTRWELLNPMGWAVKGANTFTGIQTLTTAAAQNLPRVTVASHATTADIWTAGHQIDWTGTATTTIFPNAPAAGAERVLICAGACSFTAGANMLIDGVSSGATVTCAANDTISVRAVSTTQFKLTRIKYDGTAQVSAAAGLSAATQAQVEAITDNTVALTPLSANWHPGVAKAWLKCNTAGAVSVSHNITSITDTALGQVTVTIGTDFSSADYVILVTLFNSKASSDTPVPCVESQAAGSFVVNAKQGSNDLRDPSSGYFICCFGDQA